MSGVSNLGKGITSLNRLRASIKALPLRIRTAVAKDARGILDDYMQDAFREGRTVYDTPRPLGVNGNRLTLKKSGITQATLHFKVVGTIIRAELARRYQRYLIGKYKIMPQRLPVRYAQALEQLVREYVEDFEREAAR